MARPLCTPRFRLPLCAALLAALAACEGRAGAPTPRNLLLVVLDTTRADHTGPYGWGPGRTPVLDELAGRGVTLERTYAQSSLTPVSAGSLLTGVLPHRHGLRGLLTVDENQTLREEFTTLAELFARTGRQTAGFISAPPIGANYGLERGFEHYSDRTSSHARHIQNLGIGNSYQRRADETAERALAWLEEHGGEPFCAFLHFFDAHDPALVPPRDYLEQHLSFDLPADFDELRHLAQLTDEAQRRELYAVEIRYMDEILGRVLELLGELGVLDDTAIVVVADHGEGLGQHGFWTHGLLWQEQLRVPLILAGPGLPAGRRLEGRARLVDVLPTLCELFDIAVPRDQLDGRSLLPWLAGPPEERDIYAEVHHVPGDRLGRDPELYSLTVGRWKLIHSPQTGRDRLYDLEADPTEQNDLYDPEHQMVPYLMSRLFEMGAISGGGASTEGLSEEYLQILRDLGYL